MLSLSIYYRYADSIKAIGVEYASASQILAESSCVHFHKNALGKDINPSPDMG